MFTGIITDIGKINHIEHPDDCIISISTQYDLDTVDIGASISCNGICLTVTKKQDNLVYFSLSSETLHKTSANNWKVGDLINLERALKMGDELGGHLVTGHIDGVGTVKSITPDGASRRIVINCPSELLYYIAPKGSITCDGISLTVNQVSESGFSVNIIPHTQQVTNWKTLQVGQKINLEIDMMARYITRYIDHTQFIKSVS